MRVQDSGRRTSVAQCVYRARVTVIQAVAILSSPPTVLTITAVLFDVGIATFRRGAIPIFWLFIRNRIMRRFLIKKTGDCGSPPTPKKTRRG